MTWPGRCNYEWTDYNRKLVQIFPAHTHKCGRWTAHEDIHGHLCMYCGRVVFDNCTVGGGRKARAVP